MSDCSTNAMSAPKPIHGEIVWKDGMRPTPLSYARYVNGVERIADHIDFDGERYERVRECEVVGTRFEDLLDEYCHSLSCGHDAWNGDVEPPAYCDMCGARVRGGGDGAR